ncbi:MAG: BrnT family toxin [Gallionella sp.]|nr:MAG: BrnT family toxin [Gallionella sp.]
MNFEWEETKAAANLRKHKVSFEEASTVFEDDLSLTGRDPDRSLGEHRFITFGLSAANRVLAVSHTERSGKIRIISARPATRAERRIYEKS